MTYPEDFDDPTAQRAVESGGIMWDPNSLRPRQWPGMARAFVSRTALGTVAGGVCLVIIGVAAGGEALWFTAFGALVAWCGVMSGRRNVACFVTGVCDHADRGCLVEKRPGEFCYRTRDFEAMGAVAQGIAARAIDVAEYFALNPEHPGLDPELPDAVRRRAWDILCCLDKTRTASTIAGQLLGHPEHSETADSFGRTVVDVYQQLDSSVRHLEGCVVLAKEWSRKLHGIKAAQGAEREVVSLQGIPASDVEAAAESLLQKTFFHATAARDLNRAGRFPWEQSLATGANPSAVTRCER
ncbi:hypothetical protein [Amycolatopsis sp. WGS_07]|uniref:hypothetical protein n=1 Tax=Amycolatopsis sp. WGS_07 TaxID=3076764 RepID=UPI003872F475